MFFTRNDTGILRRLRRRCRSSRASVFLEFALVAPLMVLLISAMIEFCTFWDAKVMANHAAWTVGRIVSVQDDTLLDGKANEWASVKTKSGSEFGRKIALKFHASEAAAKQFASASALATTCLMATSGMGYFGGPPGTIAANYLNELFVEPLTKLLTSVTKSLTDASGKISGWIKSADSKIPSGAPSFLKAITGAISKFVESVVKGILDKILKPIEKLINDKIKPLIDRLKSWLNDLFGFGGEGSWRWNRAKRQFYGAVVRLGKHPDVVAISDLTGSPDYSFAGEDRLKFPRTVGTGATLVKDDRKVEGWTGWPPDGSVKFALRKVKVSWPFSSGWLFPVVSGGSVGSGGTSVVVRAVGHSMVLPPCPLTNEMFEVTCTNIVDHKYDTNKVSKTREIAIRAEKFLRLNLFALKYRLEAETLSLGSTTATNGAKKTYRLLNPIAENMEFSPLRPGGPYDIDRMLRDIDYTTTYKNVLGTSDMTAAGDYSKMIEPKTIHAKDYFHWLGATRHRYRFRHAYTDGPDDHGEGFDRFGSLLLCPSGQTRPIYQELVGIRNYGSDHFDKEEWVKKRDASLKGRAWAVRKGLYMQRLVETGGMNMWGYIKLLYATKKQEADALRLIEREQLLLDGETNVMAQADSLIKGLKTKSVKELENLIANGSSIGITIDPQTGKVIGGELPPDVDPNDPDAIAKYCSKKFQEYKAKVEAEYKKLNEKIDRLDALRKEYSECAEAMVNARFKVLGAVRDFFYWVSICSDTKIGKEKGACWKHSGCYDQVPQSLDWLREKVCLSDSRGGCFICRQFDVIKGRDGEFDLIDNSEIGQGAVLEKIRAVAGAIDEARKAEEKYIEVVKAGYGGGGGQ